MHNLEELTKYEQDLMKAIYAGMSRYATSGFSDMDRMAKMNHLNNLLIATSRADIIYRETMLDNLRAISEREEVTIEGNVGYKGLARLEDGKMHGVFLGKQYIESKINYESNYVSVMAGGNAGSVSDKQFIWFKKYFEDALRQTQKEPEFIVELCQLFVWANEDLQEVIGVAMGEV